MELFKNFLIGLAVIIVSPILLLLAFIAWKLIIGLSSVLLVILISLLFFVMIFYLVVLTGYLVRSLFTKS